MPSEFNVCTHQEQIHLEANLIIQKYFCELDYILTYLKTFISIYNYVIHRSVVARFILRANAMRMLTSQLTANRATNLLSVKIF